MASPQSPACEDLRRTSTNSSWASLVPYPSNKNKPKRASAAGMETFTHHTLATTPENFTYSYYLSPHFAHRLQPSLPTLLFIHGFPDDAYMWAGAMPHMLSLGYPIVLLDLLGFGDSDKPVESNKYNYRQQAGCIAQILDKEKVPNNVIPIAQRFYLYHRDRCIGLSLLSLAYQPPSTEPFNLDAVNAATEKRFGYRQWEYWNFFTAPDGPALIEANLERFWEVNNGILLSDKPGEQGRDIWMREMFCVPDAMREYITKSGKYKDFTVDLKPYAKDEALKKRYLDRLATSGLTAPVQYYVTLKENTMIDDERVLCHGDVREINVPLLYVGQTGDWVCRTDLMGDARKEGLVGSNVTEKVIEAGHWCLYEKPQEVAEIIGDWLTKHFPK
nr:bifunctional epoxide hydrolase 2 [Quercus suber]